MLRKYQFPLICLFLTLLTLTAFWQVNNCDFVTYDDPAYVTENIQIQNGITIEAIKWAFTTMHQFNWHPLTWISHELDVQLFGLKPGRHHLTNLLLHIANTLLLFFVLHRMTKASWQSGFVAALFAIHPLHVESVAWVAERKDVLSTFFWMLTMGTYVYYVERPQVQRYLAVVAFFALGLMAKPMLVTLPFVLLLLDYWPFDRFEQKGAAPLFLEKLPLLVLTALSCIVTFIAQQKGGAVKSLEALSPGVRLANSFVSYIIYIAKTIWPARLAVYYPHPGSWPLWQVAGAVLLLTALTLLVMWKAKRFPFLAVGWLWFAGTLLPVMGIVQVGSQAMADRYTYVPLIGLFIMAAWGVPALLKENRYRKVVLSAASAVTLLCVFFLTRSQVGYWHDSISLYGHTLEVTDHNEVIHYNRGVVYAGKGDFKRAIEDFDAAIDIKPTLADAYTNRGSAHNSLGNYREAIGDFDSAIKINPGDAEAYNNRGAAYGKLGKFTFATVDFDKAIELNPKYAEAYYNRGAAYGELGNPQKAIEDFDKAIQINPDYSKAYYFRGIAYGDLGNFEQAIGDLDKAIEINPQYADAYYNRGVAYATLGNRAQAIEDLKTAARFGNEYAKNSLKKMGTDW